MLFRHFMNSNTMVVVIDNNFMPAIAINSLTQPLAGGGTFASICPEQCAGLDRLLLRLKKVFGITLVVVTHELESAFAVADRIALIHRGQFLVTGTPEEVRNSTDPVVRRFLDRMPEEETEDRHRFRQWMLEGVERVGRA